MGDKFVYASVAEKKIQKPVNRLQALPQFVFIYLGITEQTSSKQNGYVCFVLL